MSALATVPSYDGDSGVGNDVFPALRAKLDSLREARESANVKSLVTIRAIEKRLVTSLNGQPLRGLSIIAAPRYRAAAVVPPPERGGPRRGYGIDTHVPNGGREVLVVQRTGELAMVSRQGGDFSVRAALDSDLRVEDLRPIAEAVTAAVARHVERCDRSAAYLASMLDLAERLSRAL